MTAIGVAIERQDWRLVSLYLLLGVSEAAAKLPAESLVALLGILGGEGGPTKEERRGR